MDEIDDSEGVAARVIVIMVVAAVLMTIISVAVITTIIHNVYAATYYSIGSLFDANGQSASNFIGAALVSGSAGVFYEFIGISLLDGIAKVFIIGFLIAAFIDLLSNIDIKSKLDIITARRLKGHVIICGYSMLAERLCKDLKKDNMHFVSNILESASIRNARAIVFATESDFVNLLGVVTAHHIIPELEIISRVRHEASISNIEKAGAVLCLVPEMVAGSELGEHISKLLA
jgi:voltage-gated potassium channel Kch